MINGKKGGREIQTAGKQSSKISVVRFLAPMCKICHPVVFLVYVQVMLTILTDALQALTAV